MVQVGIMTEIYDRSFEDYESLHKSLRHAYADKAKETKVNKLQLSTGSAVEVAEIAGETIALATGAGETWGILSDTDDAAYDGESVTIVWEDVLGVQYTSTALYNVANSTTFSAFTVPAAITTGLTIISAVSSVVVQAGDNVYVGTSGCAATPAERRATILTGATAAVAAGLVGIGSIEVQTAADVAADRGTILNFKYVTIYGKLKYATVTTAAGDSSTVVLPLEATYSRNPATGVETYTATTRYVADFWRLKHGSFAQLLGAQDLFLQRRTVLGAAAIYNAMLTLTNRFVTTRFGASTRSYLGSIRASFPSVAGVLTVQATYTKFGDTLAHTESWDVLGHDTIEICERLKVGTDVTIKILDDGATHANANIHLRCIEIET